MLRMETEDIKILSGSSDRGDRDGVDELSKSDFGLNEPYARPDTNVAKENMTFEGSLVVNEELVGNTKFTNNGESLGINEDVVGNEECTKDGNILEVNEGALGYEECKEDGEVFEPSESNPGNEEETNAGRSGFGIGDNENEDAAKDHDNLLLKEGDSVTEEVQFQTEVDMDLVCSPVRQVNIEVVDTVAVSKKPTISSTSGNVENCFLDAPNNRLVHNEKMGGSHVSSVKRKRVTYDEQQPSVRITYNSLTRASKQKLEELLQQWSEWHSRQDSSSHDSDELLLSGEDTYFPALCIGMEKTSAVSFWIENQTRKQLDSDLIPPDCNAVPLYDRGYVLGLASADGPTNVDRGLEIVDDAARCFNCGSYNHSLKECPKPRDTVAVNNARKQHKSKRNQNPSSRNATRYYQCSSGGKFDGLKPGSLDTETRHLLGLGELDPPPWLNRMRELGYPPGYLDPDNEDEPSGITIFADEDVNGEQEDGEIKETDHPELQRKKSVEFPGINAPIPENADQRLWDVGPSGSEPFRNRRHHRSSHSSEAAGRWHHHEQRKYRDFSNDDPPGVDSVFSPSRSSYPLRYGHYDSSYSSDSPRDLNPSFGRSSADRGRSGSEYEDFASHSSSYSSRKHSSSWDTGPARYEADNSRSDYDLDYSYRDYSFRSEHEYDRYRHRSWR